MEIAPNQTYTQLIVMNGFVKTNSFFLNLDVALQ